MAKDISNLTNDERNDEVHDLIDDPSQQNASEPAGLVEARESAYAAPQKNDNDSQSTEQNNHNGTETRRYQSGYARNNESTQGSESGSTLPQLKIEGKAVNDSSQSTLDLGAPQHELRISSVSQIRQRTDGTVGDNNLSIGSTLSKLTEHRRSESSPEAGSLGELYVQAGLKLAETPSIKERINGATTASINSRFLSADMPVFSESTEARFQTTAPLNNESPSQESKKAPNDSASPLDSYEPGKPESVVHKLPSILPIRDGGGSNSPSPSQTDKAPANRIPADKAPSPTDGDGKSPTKPGIGSFISNIIGAACTTGCGENNDKPQKPTRDAASPGQGILGGIMSVIGNQKKPPASESPDRTPAPAPAPTPRDGAPDRQQQQPVLNSIGQIIGTQIRPDERRGSGDNNIGHAISNYVNNQNNPEQRRATPVADSSVGAVIGNIINSGGRTATDAQQVVPTVARDQRTQSTVGEQLQNIITRTSSDNAEAPKPTFKDSILPILQDLFNSKDRVPEQVNPADKQSVILEPRHEQRVIEQDRVNDRVSNNIIPAALEFSARNQTERCNQQDSRIQSDPRVPASPPESKAARHTSEQATLSSHIVSAGVSFNRAMVDAVHISPKQIQGEKQVSQSEIAGPIKLADLKSGPLAERTSADIIKHGDILKPASTPGAHKAVPESEQARALKVPSSESGMSQSREQQNRRIEPAVEQKGKGLRELAPNLPNAENRLLGPGGKQSDQNPLPLHVTEADKNGQIGNKSGAGHKDVNEKKEDSFTEKATVLIAGRKARREEKPSDSKRQPDKKSSSEPEVRSRYAVRPGDTLQSIAKNHLLDERFALLLEMINRANLQYKFEGNLRKVVLRVGQNIWLPTSSEMKVHRTLFFTERNSKQLSSDPETSLLSAHTQVQNVLVDLNPAERTGQEHEQARTPSFENSNEERFEHHSTFLSNLSDLPKPKVIRKVTRKAAALSSRPTYGPALITSAETESKNLFSVLNAIRHTGDREPSSLPELTIFDSNEHKAISAGVEKPVRMENKGMEASNNTFDMLSKIFEQQNGIATQKPSTEASNIGDVLKRLRESAAANKNNRAEQGNFAAEQPVDTFVDLVQQKDLEQLLVQLNENVRVTSKETSTDRASFVIALQTKIQNQWTTVASYESKRGRTARFLFRKNGARQEFALQLPQFVVRNMALQDFTRNHQNYISEFLGESSQRRSSTLG